ncbi:MAG: hypothetical protein WCI11_20460 [Candidatus Methylumidiphilus sp.]
MITPNQASGEIRPKSAQSEGETFPNPTETLASLLVIQCGLTDKLSNLVETIYLIAQFKQEDHSNLKGALNLCSSALLEIYGTSLSVEGRIRRLVEGGCDERETR